MSTGTLNVRLYAPWVHSLKEKRMEIKSLIAKIRGRFNASAAEVAEQDTHQTLCIGVAVVSASQARTSELLDDILRFIEGNTEAEITAADRELL